jgi:hypothetical protein
MDKLEEHIRKNREDLDRYTPSSGTWKKISRKIKREKTPVRKWLSIAAMFIVILGTALVFIKYGAIWSGSGMLKNGDATETSQNTQLKETEIYYNNLVNSIYLEAKPLLTANPEIQKELVTDFSHLDSICSEIKKDLKDNVANQEVVEALIQNYRIKIQLLEDMLTVLKENENIPEKKKSHEL